MSIVKKLRRLTKAAGVRGAILLASKYCASLILSIISFTAFSSISISDSGAALVSFRTPFILIQTEIHEANPSIRPAAEMVVGPRHDRMWGNAEARTRPHLDL